MPLNIDDKKNIIKYRAEKSASTMIEAKDNANLGHWNLVANRLYYALFYMIAALLLFAFAFVILGFLWLSLRLIIKTMTFMLIHL